MFSSLKLSVLYYEFLNEVLNTNNSTYFNMKNMQYKRN